MTDVPKTDEPRKEKKFQARRSIVKEERLRQTEVFGGAAIPNSDHRLMLEDQLSMSIRRHGRPLPMTKLQGELLLDIVEAESCVSQYKKKLRELEDSKADEADIDYVKSELFKYRRLRYALRDIGDGIAWRFLDFNRCALTHIANHPRKQHINKEGTGQELHELSDIITANNEVAILNDITHVFKKGDVSAKLKDGSIEFVEVKSSNTKSRRLIRQKNDLEETISFLNDGEKVKDGEIYKILSLPITPESYIRNLEVLLKRAEKDCLVVDKIGDHLVIHVTDFTAVDSKIDPEPSFKKRNQILSEWEAKGDTFFDFSSVDRHSHVQNFAPFSVFPIPHRLRVKMMTGALLVGTTLNVSAVLRYLSKRGWNTIKGPKEFAKEIDNYPPHEVPVAAIKKGPLTAHLPAPMVARLGNEYLSLRTLGDYLDSILTAEQKFADGIFINMEFESAQWD